MVLDASLGFGAATPSRQRGPLQNARRGHVATVATLVAWNFHGRLPFGNDYNSFLLKIAIEIVSFPMKS